MYGHSLANNDDHYLERIEKGELTHLYVGIYGDPDSPSNKAFIGYEQTECLVLEQAKRPVSKDVGLNC